MVLMKPVLLWYLLKARKKVEEELKEGKDKAKLEICISEQIEKGAKII